MSASEYTTNRTVTEAEYRSLLLSFDLLTKHTKGRVIICGNFNLVIIQMRGGIDCKAPGLQLLRHKAMEKLRSWPMHKFLHIKRYWNQSADRLASAALQQEKGTNITFGPELKDVMVLNWLDEMLTPRGTDQVVKMSAITRSAVRRLQPKPMRKEIVQQIRIGRIKQSQEEKAITRVSDWGCSPSRQRRS